MPKFKKAPKFEGKDLTLDLGRGSLKPKDGVLYGDPRLARYVPLGMMVRVQDEGEAPAAPSAPKAEPVPVPESPKEEVVETTRYTESELAKNNKAALADLGAGMGLELDMSMTKADMIEAILKQQG